MWRKCSYKCTVYMYVPRCGGNVVINVQCTCMCGGNVDSSRILTKLQTTNVYKTDTDMKTYNTIIL